MLIDLVARDREPGAPKRWPLWASAALIAPGSFTAILKAFQFLDRGASIISVIESLDKFGAIVLHPLTPIGLLTGGFGWLIWLTKHEHKPVLLYGADQKPLQTLARPILAYAGGAFVVGSLAVVVLALVFWREQPTLLAASHPFTHLIYPPKEPGRPIGNVGNPSSSRLSEPPPDQASASLSDAASDQSNDSEPPTPRVPLKTNFRPALPKAMPNPCLADRKMDPGTVDILDQNLQESFRIRQDFVDNRGDESSRAAIKNQADHLRSVIQSQIGAACTPAYNRLQPIEGQPSGLPQNFPAEALPSLKLFDAQLAHLQQMVNDLRESKP